MLEMHYGRTDTLSPPKVELGSKHICWSWMHVKEMNAIQMTKTL